MATILIWQQELCLYVLDALHEDLNRVKKKPYVEMYEPKGGEPDQEVAREFLKRHRQRNQSHIADLFEGQFKSNVHCPTRLPVLFVSVQPSVGETNVGSPPTL